MSPLQDETSALGDRASAREGVREFTSARPNPLLLLGVVVGPVVAVMWPRLDTGDFVGLAISVAAACWYLIEYLARKPHRLVVSPDGLMVTVDKTEHAALWRSVVKAVHVTNEARLLLHLDGGETIAIPLGAFAHGDEIVPVAKAYLPELVELGAVRTDAAKPLAAVLIVAVGAGVIAAMAVFFLGDRLLLRTAIIGALLGLVVSVAVLRLCPSWRRRIKACAIACAVPCGLVLVFFVLCLFLALFVGTRVVMGLVLGAVVFVATTVALRRWLASSGPRIESRAIRSSAPWVAAAVVTALWLLFALKLRRSFPSRLLPEAIAFLVAYGYTLFIVQIIARLVEVQRGFRRAITPRPSDHT